MSDEDIEFLGTKPAQKSGSYISTHSMHRPVTGLVLHVERSSTSDAYRMTFQRKTSVIHIGRRPGAESESRFRDIDSGKAMFRCAVVSRKHAKIAFSDSGHAYLIDLGSHHGTHVRKPGELFSKMLQPETPALLADGDIVTFGKSVGKNDECVRPMVVRIELLRNPQPSIKPLFVPSNPSSPSAKSVSSRSSSGRYGIYNPSSSSSDESSSPSFDRDSDIEEIPPPPPSGSLKKSQSESGIESVPPSGVHRAIDVLKRLFPPTHTPNREQSPEIEITYSNIDHPRSNAVLPAMDVLGSPEYSYPNSPVSRHYSPWTPRYSPTSPVCSPMRSNLPPLEDFYPVGFDASEHDIYEPLEYKSRSHSPMELESPSSPPAPLLPPAEPIEEPAVIGAWPVDTPVATPVATPSSSDAGVASEPVPIPPNEAVAEDLVPPSAPVEVTLNDGRHAEEQPECIIEAKSDVEIVTSESSRHISPAMPTVNVQMSTTAEAPEPMDVAEKISSNEIKELKATVSNLQLDVSKLQNHRRKYKSRFNANVRTLAEKITDFDDRIEDANTQYKNLSEKLETVTNVDIADLSCQLEEMQEQIEGLTHIDVPDLQSQVDGLEDQVIDVLGKYEEATAAREKTTQLNVEVQAEIKILCGLVDEMKKLREAAQAQMAAEIEVVKTLREVTMAKIAAEAVIETPVLTSLKRKRDDTDENESRSEAEGSSFSDGGVTVNVAAQQRVVSPSESDVEAMMDDAPTPPSRYVQALEALDMPPPRKRMRRFATVMARTATAVTLGAVATWSALAFS